MTNTTSGQYHLVLVIVNIETRSVVN